MGTSPMDRSTGSVVEADRDSRDEVRAGVAGPSLLRVTLFGIAAKAVADWIKDGISMDVASSGPVPRPQTEYGSIVSPRADT